MKLGKWGSFLMAGRRTRVIHSIGALISAELDLDRLLPLIAKSIKGMLGLSYCGILLKEGNELVIRAITEHPDEIIGRRIPLGQGNTGRCAASRREVLVPDLSRCPEYICLGDDVFRSELDLPIIYHDRVLGVLNIQGTRRDDFSRGDIQLMRILSNQIGVALHNSLVLAQMALLQDIGMKLSAITKAKDLFESIVRETRQRLHYDNCAILEASGEHLVFKASSEEFPRELIGLRIPFGEGITGRCAREKRTINIGDVRRDSGYIRSGIAEIRSEIACPLISEGELLGVLTVESQTENAFDDDDVRLLSILALQVAAGMRNAKMYTEIESLAITDPLTGLYNYRYFYQRLASEVARSQRYRHPLSVILIDLDDFKSVNDRYGHLAGDRVLREAAQAVRRNIRRYDEPVVMKGEVDIVSRYGGEEFIVIMPDTPLEGALVCAERLRGIVEKTVGAGAGLPYEQGAPRRITGSFGVAAFETGESLEDMVRRADQAMYRAKEEGKNRVAAA